MKSPLEQFDIITIKLWGPLGLDLSLNNILIPVCLLIVFLLLLICINDKRIIDLYMWTILEKQFIFIVNIIKQQAGVYGLFYLPFVYVLFSLILYINLLSLLPFGIALSSHLILIFLLSVTVCVSIFLIGLLRFNLKFLHIFIPQCPFMLMPILIPIEMFSYLIRLFSLAIRLAANILAGHTLVHIIINFIYNIWKLDIVLAFIAFIPLFLILILEFGVAALQAYVFTVLVCIYLSDTEKIAVH